MSMQKIQVKDLGFVTLHISGRSIPTQFERNWDRARAEEKKRRDAALTKA